MAAPQKGHRGYRLAQWALVIGGALSAFGIYRGVDLVGLAALVTGLITAALGATAYRAHGEYKHGSRPTSSTPREG